MITVVGSINVDLVATATRFPTPGETVAGRSFSISPGGKGANQALAASRAGSAVRLVGAVGSDGLASDALALLEASRVDLTMVRREPTSTGTAMVLVDSAGENMITVVPGANGHVDAEAAHAALPMMHCSDILMLQMEIPAETIEAVLVTAREQKVTTILNTAPFTADTQRMAAAADILVSNETEFELLVGRPIRSIDECILVLREVHGRSRQSFVVTLGANGAVAVHNGEILSAKSMPITPVDTVGAGDTFCGYLAAGLDQGRPFAEALKRAAIAGSLACQYSGAQSAIPFIQAVDNLAAGVEPSN